MQVYLSFLIARCFLIQSSSRSSSFLAMTVLSFVFLLLFFFFNDPATTEIYTLSLHDALPILALDSLGVSSSLSGIEPCGAACFLAIASSCPIRRCPAPLCCPGSLPSRRRPCVR